MDISTRTPRVYAGGHHARLIDERVPYHLISRVFQGRHLLRPDAATNEIILGVIGRAQSIFEGVDLYAFAFMSNHFHAMAKGPAQQLSAFIGYIKREISRRLGARPDINWPGTMWHEYIATALPTDASQLNCIKYILAQGTKEGLVERPQDWPGAHCVKALMLGRELSGKWLDSTSFLRARQAEQRKREPGHVKRADYLSAYKVNLTPLPCWAELNESEQQSQVAAIVQGIVAEARSERAKHGKKVVGAKNVLKVSRERRTSLPKLPWYESRRRMICWANPRDAEVQRYISEYWDFQKAFKRASMESRASDFPNFPARSFAPGRHRAVTTA